MTRFLPQAGLELEQKSQDFVPEYRRPPLWRVIRPLHPPNIPIRVT